MQPDRLKKNCNQSNVQYLWLPFKETKDIVSPYAVDLKDDQKL